MNDTRHTVDPKFVIPRQGKQMVLYVGLLDAAHRAGMVSMQTEILQFPTKENDQTCIVRATVRIWPDTEGRGHPKDFTGIGDANPKNVGGTIVPHFIRMAETRAKARALRDALNVGMVTVEELGGDDERDEPRPQSQPARRRPSHPSDDGFGPAPQPRPTPPTAPAPSGEPLLTAQQFDALIDSCWTQVENGMPLQGIKLDLNNARPRMSEAQRLVARQQLTKIEEAIAERAAPAIAG